jgi:hypothetical protein
LWTLYLLLAAGLFGGLNLYLSWLQSKIVPFSAPLDLSEAGGPYEYTISRLPSYPYTCMLDLSVPREDWWAEEESEAGIRADLNVHLKIELMNSTGEAVLRHDGTLRYWTLTNGSFTDGANASLYKHTFPARFGEEYRLLVTVVRGSKRAHEYAPQLLLYGIDDGYFWLRWRIDNLLLALLVAVPGGVLMVITLLSRTVRNRRLKQGHCPWCDYPMGVAGKCTECGRDLPARPVA